MGLKTTYYLRTLAASQIEKSTLDAAKFGFTQKREYMQSTSTADAPSKITTPLIDAINTEQIVSQINLAQSNVQSKTQSKVESDVVQITNPKTDAPKLCKILDLDCVACQ